MQLWCGRSHGGCLNGGCGFVSIKLYLQKQAALPSWPMCYDLQAPRNDPDIAEDTMLKNWWNYIYNLSQRMSQICPWTQHNWNYKRPSKFKEDPPHGLLWGGQIVTTGFLKTRRQRRRLLTQNSVLSENLFLNGGRGEAFWRQMGTGFYQLDSPQKHTHTEETSAEHSSRREITWGDLKF